MFDRVQELRSHKRRNTKTGRKSLFAGLLYCPDCGAKLHFCAAKSLKLNQEFYRCANYNSGRGICDIHYIRNVVLEQIVAEAVGSLADFVRCYESVFLYLLAKNNNVARQSEVQKLKQSLATSERRIKMIDKAIEELFEANISGKVSDERFVKMTDNYEKEQKELLELVADGNKKLQDAEHMKLQKDARSRHRLHEAVGQSALYDRKLGMYRVNEALDRSQLELGRAAAFTPGWLENGSVWLHMEYKYLLELLKGGLYEEFFREFRRCGVPFLNEAVYGRSTTENVSFIVSSLNPDERLHGRGFVARLSGSTAEFLQMWQLMFFGPKPFKAGENGIELDLRPAIPEYLIDETLTLEATFAGACRVRLHFAEKRDYFPGSYTVTRLTCSRTPDEIRRGAQSRAELWME